MGSGFAGFEPGRRFSCVWRSPCPPSFVTLWWILAATMSGRRLARDAPPRRAMLLPPQSRFAQPPPPLTPTPTRDPPPRARDRQNCARRLPFVVTCFATLCLLRGVHAFREDLSVAPALPPRDLDDPGAARAVYSTLELVRMNTANTGGCAARASRWCSQLSFGRCPQRFDLAIRWDVLNRLLSLYGVEGR